MKAEQISDALNWLDDDIVAEAGGFVRTWRWKHLRAWPAAAVLCIAAALLAAGVIGRNIQLHLYERSMEITAEKITEFSGGILMGGGTTNGYITMPAQDLQELMRSPVRDNSEVTALPVFKPTPVADISKFADDCAEQFVQGLNDALGAGVEIQDILDWNENTDEWNAYGFMRDYSINCDGFEASMRVENDFGAAQAYYILKPLEGEPLSQVTVPLDAEDEELLRASSAMLDMFNRVFDREFEPVQVIRHTDRDGNLWCYVYAWDTSGSLAEQMCSAYLDYVYITFTNYYTLQEGHKERLELIGMRYNTLELERVFAEDTELLSLDEALEELEKGYIFLGHVCPVCISRNNPLDFSDYDGVEIVYRFDRLYTYNIPYYAFYKQAEEGVVAVTYVPAVKVSGMDEYFQQQESWHNTED